MVGQDPNAEHLLQGDSRLASALALQQRRVRRRNIRLAVIALKNDMKSFESKLEAIEIQRTALENKDATAEDMGNFRASFGAIKRDRDAIIENMAEIRAQVLAGARAGHDAARAGGVGGNAEDGTA